VNIQNTTRNKYKSPATRRQEVRVLSNYVFESAVEMLHTLTDVLEYEWLTAAHEVEVTYNLNKGELHRVVMSWQVQRALLECLPEYQDD